MSIIPNSNILDMMIAHYHEGYSITQICWIYKIPVQDIHETFTHLNIITSKKKPKKFTSSQKRQITKTINYKPVKRPKSYNGYLRTEIKKMEAKLESPEYTDLQKTIIRSTIRRYKFIIKRHYTKYNGVDSYELIGI